MPFLKTNNINFFYEWHGNPLLPPLVFISGYTCDHSMWDPLLPFLKDSYRILTFDNQGIGKTQDQNNALLPEIMADNIFDLIQTLEVKSPILVGYAMGSTLAQEIAIKHGYDISRLILINSVAKWSTSAIADVEKLIKLRKENRLEAMFGLLYDIAFSTQYKKNTSKNDFIKQNKSIESPVIQSITDQERQSAVLKQFDSRNRLSQIATKTLIISAKEDPLGTEEDATQLAHGIPNAIHKSICTGHASIYEQPQQISEIILKFTNPIA